MYVSQNRVQYLTTVIQWRVHQHKTLLYAIFDILSYFVLSWLIIREILLETRQMQKSTKIHPKSFFTIHSPNHSSHTPFLLILFSMLSYLYLSKLMVNKFRAGWRTIWEFFIITVFVEKVIWKGKCETICWYLGIFYKVGSNI